MRLTDLSDSGMLLAWLGSTHFGLGFSVLRRFCSVRSVVCGCFSCSVVLRFLAFGVLRSKARHFSMEDFLSSPRSHQRPCPFYVHLDAYRTVLSRFPRACSIFCSFPSQCPAIRFLKCPITQCCFRTGGGLGQLLSQPV